RRPRPAHAAALDGLRARTREHAGRDRAPLIRSPNARTPRATSSLVTLDDLPARMTLLQRHVRLWFIPAIPDFTFLFTTRPFCAVRLWFTLMPPALTWLLTTRLLVLVVFMIVAFGSEVFFRGS